MSIYFKKKIPAFAEITVIGFNSFFTAHLPNAIVAKEGFGTTQNLHFAGCQDITGPCPSVFLYKL
jgi:hypothetical protein